jgi:PleD family two-component response regulator
MSEFARAMNVAATEIKGPEDRDKTGPLPIVNDLVAMAARLAAERDRMAETNGRCFVAVCTADPIQGWTRQQSIAETALRFSNSLRAYDSIFVCGSDKILVCLPFVKHEDTTSVMERLRDLASRMPVNLPDGVTGHVKVSVGGVMMDRSMSVPEMIERADKAMELGLLSGNRACMWSSDML